MPYEPHSDEHRVVEVTVLVKSSAPTALHIDACVGGALLPAVDAAQGEDGHTVMGQLQVELHLKSNTPRTSLSERHR